MRRRCRRSCGIIKKTRGQKRVRTEEILLTAQAGKASISQALCPSPILRASPTAILSTTEERGHLHKTTTEA